MILLKLINWWDELATEGKYTQSVPETEPRKYSSLYSFVLFNFCVVLIFIILPNKTLLKQ